MDILGIKFLNKLTIDAQLDKKLAALRAVLINWSNIAALWGECQ